MGGALVQIVRSAKFLPPLWSHLPLEVCYGSTRVRAHRRTAE
uniref:Uncharacterized protein n=1 Tax=Arundo donax TaxID=35708 RepID=A0A0A9AEA7_ARUDO